MRSKINNFSIYLLLLFPMSLVAGPFVAELFMNLISIIFIIFFFKRNDIFSRKFLFLFLFFYIYILINSFISPYSDKILIKNIFYFRHFIFVFAVVHLLNSNKNLSLLFYKSLGLTIFIVVIDGYIQYFFDYNILGYPKYRPDRLSGFFNDRLILGSYLARLLPLFLGLFLYIKKKISVTELYFTFLLILITFILIILSGERSSLVFATIILGIFLILFENKFKLYIFLIILILFCIVFGSDNKVYDRVINQTKNQIVLSNFNKNILNIFTYYKTTYKTAYKAFLENKILGQGPSTFRFFCNDKKFVVYEQLVYAEGELNIIKLPLSWKDKNIKIENIFVKIGDQIKEGDLILNYEKKGKINSYFYKGYSGTIENIYLSKNSIASGGQYIAKVSFDKNQKIQKKYKRNGCTTHPHNFYLQLLSETGIIGFITIFSVFLFFLIKLLKSFYRKIFNIKDNYARTLIIAGFVATLFPLIPNGNFFNNWLNMIMFLPVPFYLFFNKNKNEKKFNKR